MFGGVRYSSIIPLPATPCVEPLKVSGPSPKPSLPLSGPSSACTIRLERLGETRGCWGLHWGLLSSPDSYRAALSVCGVFCPSGTRGGPSLPRLISAVVPPGFPSPRLP